MLMTGLQQNILNRYGIRNFAVKGLDYRFKNGDYYDFRHYNIEVINSYHGVRKEFRRGRMVFVARINIYGSWTIGTYSSPINAAVAYNKAVDFVISKGISSKNYTKNYIEELDSQAYKEIYEKLRFLKDIRHGKHQLIHTLVFWNCIIKPFAIFKRKSDTALRSSLA